MYLQPDIDYICERERCIGQSSTAKELFDVLSRATIDLIKAFGGKYIPDEDNGISPATLVNLRRAFALIKQHTRFEPPIQVQMVVASMEAVDREPEMMTRFANDVAYYAAPLMAWFAVVRAGIAPYIIQDDKRLALEAQQRRRTLLSRISLALGITAVVAGVVLAARAVYAAKQ
jgi:hypothetical protein